MQILLINLDRQPMRLKRMEELLRGLSFERIGAVDGKTIDGLDRRINPEPVCRADLSRYEIACILSHRAAWLRFLAGKERYCCILEDDVFLSTDFSKFINDESWLPENSDLVKIETYDRRVFLSRKKIPCLNRSVRQLHSLHFGTGGYILSRKGASILLDETSDPNRTLDRILFDEPAVQKWSPVYQLFPALCIQGRNIENGILFPEMQSAINPRPLIKPPRLKKKKTLLQRIKNELAHPLHKLKKFAATKALERRLQACCCIVPFA
jgi:glycosyl transferase family 25